MNKELLMEAIGYLDEDLLERSEQCRMPKRKQNWVTWTALAASVCLLLSGAWWLFGSGVRLNDASTPEDVKPGVNQNTADTKPDEEDVSGTTGNKALTLAVYPEMAPYPKESEWGTDAYSQWLADRQVQRGQETPYKDGLYRFASVSARQLLTETNSKNTVYSPLNVYMALAMLTETTDQNTRQQLLNALGEKTIQELRAKANAMWNAHYNNDGAMTSILANAIWLNEGLTCKQKTLDILAEDYYASSYQGDMGSEAFNALLQEWLNAQTGGLLEEYTQNVELEQDTILALASTVLFRAKWKDAFSKENTKQMEFFAADEKSPILCDFMNQTGSSTYYWGKNFSAVAKPLQDSGAMWFFLPDEGVSPEQLLEENGVFQLLENQSQWKNSKYMMVNLSVPEFDVSSELDLVPGLQAMGITDVFSREKADFSPLAEEPEEIYLKQARHAARVAIDEEGCVAAAYTVLTAPGSPPPPEETVDFVLNRPFLFVITGWDGLPLFVGIVNNPG